MASALTAVATSLPAVAVLVRHRLRTSPAQRVMSIAESGLALNPFVVIVLLASSLVLVDSILGGAVGAIAGATASGATQLGATGQQVQTLTADGMAVGSVLFALPALLVYALFAGRRAAHYIDGNKAPVMLAAAVGYVLIRMLIVVGLGSVIAGAGFVQSLWGWAFSYGLAGVALGLVLLAGAWWARTSHEGFVGSRLLAELTPDDRRTALDLLAGAAMGSRTTPPTTSIPTARRPS